MQYFNPKDVTSEATSKPFSPANNDPNAPYNLGIQYRLIAIDTLSL